MINFLSLMNHSVMITLFVFLMMIFIECINVLTRGRMTEVVKGEKGGDGKNGGTQYICLDSNFFN